MSGKVKSTLDGAFWSWLPGVSSAIRLFAGRFGRAKSVLRRSLPALRDASRSWIRIARKAIRSRVGSVRRVRGRALVAGWFSYEGGHCTAGDLMACDVACQWLEQAGYDYHVASVPPFVGEVDWRQVEEKHYSHAVFVCGPFHNGPMERAFVDRFASCQRIGLTLTMQTPLDDWNPFDLLVERDSSRRTYPDITFCSAQEKVPVVGICRVEEYDGGLVQRANEIIDRLIASREMAVVEIDTRLDANSTGLRSPAEVESLLARMDVVVTTRMHGMVLSLKNGVPVVAIDPEVGGAKVHRQADTIGWPVIFDVDTVADESLSRALDFCLTPAARSKAVECTRKARRIVDRMRDEFLAFLRRTRVPDSMGPKPSALSRARPTAATHQPAAAKEYRVASVSQRPFNHNLVQGASIDLPRPESVVADRIEIAGWALGTRSKIRAVAVYRDGRRIGEFPLGALRTDVAAAFGDTADVNRCGFSVSLPVGDSSRPNFSVRALMESDDETEIGVFGLVETGRTVAVSARNVAKSNCPSQPGTSPINFGDLRRTEPISRDFGFDRGSPVDRHYIELFLDRHKHDIRGRVLEIGDDSYTRAFGGDRVSNRDVLHVSEKNPHATIVADIAQAEHIPSDLFDCIILTQTLHLIYDVPAALRTLRRILKPNGVLLATFPGISQIARDEWGKTWYWSFTSVSAQRLFNDAFGEGQTIHSQWGNVLSATAFLQGLAAHELTADELAVADPQYPVILGARAQKPIPIAPPTALAAAISSAAPRTAILVYHRVVSLDVDPWGLAVAPEHFAEHLDVLRENGYHPVRLSDLTDLGAAALPDRSVVLTSDDGYADNAEIMLPLLEKYEIPATLYLTTGGLGRNREYWWDELERLILHRETLPPSLRLIVDSRSYVWKVGQDALPGKTDKWVAWEDPPGPRHYLFRSLWELFHPLAVDVREALLAELREWSAATSTGSRPSHRLIDEATVRTLADSPLIEIGAHTETHSSLASLSLDDQRREVEGSVSRLENLTGRKIRSFSYPFGKAHDFSEQTVAILRDFGIVRACTTIPRLRRPGDDPFRLPRIHVCDQDGASFREMLDRWFA